MTSPTIPTGCTGYYAAQLGRIHHDGPTCPIHETAHVVNLDGPDYDGIRHELPAIVTGPLWVRRYDEARRAEATA